MKCWRYILALPWIVLILWTSTSVGADSVPARLKEGDEFVIRQVFTKSDGNTQSYLTRFKVMFRNNTNQLVVGVASGTPANVKAEPIYQVAYKLANDSCIVDVVGGIALSSGQKCDAPLRDGQAFAFKEPSGETSKCVVAQPAREGLQVPAGTFVVMKLSCTTELSSLSQTRQTEYWYVPAIGIMGKVVRHFVDRAGANVATLTEQLEAFPK
jgi:hypothetical protein